MKNKQSSLSIKTLLLMTCFFSACAHDTQKDAQMTEPAAQTANPEAEAKNGVSIEAKLAAAEDNSNEVTEVIFEKGQSELSSNYQDKVESALAAAEKKSPITHITIVAWSDSEMPKKGEKLPQASIDLAKARAQGIQNKIHATRAKVGIEVVNMAERPGKFKKFLKTNDVRIQEALSSVSKGDAKASHGIVIIETKLSK